MKTSLLKLKQESNTYFDAHRQVKSFFWGDFIRLYAENQIQHSSVIIQPLRLGELSRSQVTVQLVVTYSDRIFSDFSNLDEVHSEAADVLNDFVMVLNTSPRWKDFVLGATNGNAEFFTQRSGDLVAGAAMILNVRIKSVADLCAIPATDYDFEVQPTPLPSCADVTVVNSNGEYSVQVSSGGLLELPDTPVTVTDQNGNELASEDLPSVTGGNIEVTIPEPEPCEDATYNLDNTEGSTLLSGSIPSGDNETIIAPDGTATVKNTQNTTVATGLVPSGGAANITAPDATFSINSTQVATIPSGTSDSIQVRKQSGSDQIGALQGQHWRIANSAITLKDTANNTLSTTNVPATESAEIVAPDGTIENTDSSYTDTVASGGTLVLPDSQINVNGVNEGDVVSVQTIDVNITDGTDPVTPDSVSLVGNTLTIEVPSGGDEWQRPSDWLAMPTVTSADDTFVGLYAIHPNGNNFAAFRFTTDTGQYQVDWGDGTVDLLNSNVIAEHTYDYDIYDPTDTTLSTRGYKQAMIVVTPVTGQLRTANFQLRRTTTPTQNQAYATGFLDCILSMPNANSGQSIVFGGTTVRHSFCERFNLLNSGNLTSMSSMFQVCFSLQSVPLFDTSNVTSMANMFSACYALQSVPLFDTSNVTSMAAMFQNCLVLKSVPLFDTNNVTTMASMFNNCSSLKSVPLLNTSNVTSMANMFNGCVALQSVPLLNTLSVTTMAGMFNGCQSLQSIPALSTAAITTTTGTNFTLFSLNCFSLDRCEMVFARTVNLTNGQLSRDALVEIFNNLVDRTGTTAANINISGNWGAAVGGLSVLDRAIATAKNWTITG